ncbi:hypothetical protein GDO78_004931 [Eleutherodactylus coqui]|uniref:Peptidase M12B domain-containing protein n=1 Tax=Eleutherodactylus coqui TaxID=57060 RepID=A0A8J6KGY3_ELECQ|nr:hypothetical protein GDO78_004931 [Eleutherodactylus coqui]KAG9488645.1 hypothetical protein GDO78_004931 [Eleutherodactylus coqui]
MAAAAASPGVILLITCSVVLGLDPSSFLSSYEIIIPQKLTRLRRDASGSLMEGLAYVIQAEGEKHVLHLEHNRDLLAKDFTVYTYSENGSRLASPLHQQDLCHYQGYAEGYPESRVAVSTCSGLRGLLHLSNGSYGIEPLQSSSNFQHLIYRLEDVKQEPMVCGVSSHEGSHESQHNHSLSMTELLRRKKRAILPQTRYVELFLVVDKERMYSMLNIRIVLVGLEIWTNVNHINIDGSAAEVLGRFVQWRETQLLPRRTHDSAQLVLKKRFGFEAGMAFVGTVCSRSHAGGINVFSHRNTASFSSIVAHELGHNLGMNHDDDRGCSCSTKYCIMNSRAPDSKNFSSCSEDDFEKLILNKGGNCLLNMPRPEEGTICRAVTNECDLPEYCNGSSPYCQPDEFIQNGHLCRNNQSYCYNAICQYHDVQCQGIFGQNAKAADPVCFQNVNSKGDRFGNCGFQGNTYKPCGTHSPHMRLSMSVAGHAPVVPLLALGVFVFFRRNELKRKFCEMRRSHGTMQDVNRDEPKNGPGRDSPARDKPRNAPNNVPGRGGALPGAARNASQMQAARVPPNSRPQRNLQNVLPGGGYTANAPPRNVPPMGPNRNIPPSSYEIRQPQHTPSRPLLPRQRDTALPTIAPARPPPAPPV